jgi:hypothetical protein
MILLKTAVIPAVMCLTLSAATALHAQERMRTGMWEGTVTAASGQSATRSYCFKPEDAAKSNGSPAVVRAETEKAMSKSACTLKDFNLDSNTLTLTMLCAGPPPTRRRSSMAETASRQLRPTQWVALLKSRRSKAEEPEIAKQGPSRADIRARIVFCAIKQPDGALSVSNTSR